MGDRIVVMKDGVIQQIDTPLNLYNHPANAFVGGFIGSPAMNFLPGRLVSTAEGFSFESEGNGVTIPVSVPEPEVRAALGAAVGEEVWLGFRPEDLYIEGGVSVPALSHPIGARLDVIEPMGNEIFIYAQFDGHAIVARVAPQALPAPGQLVAMRLDLGKLHFFDRTSGRAIR